MKNQLNNYLTSLADHLTAQYGERGTATREEFEAFTLGTMLEKTHNKKAAIQAQTFNAIRTQL